MIVVLAWWIIKLFLQTHVGKPNILCLTYHNGKWGNNQDASFNRVFPRCKWKIWLINLKERVHNTFPLETIKKRALEILTRIFNCYGVSFMGFLDIIVLWCQSSDLKICMQQKTVVLIGINMETPFPIVNHVGKNPTIKYWLLLSIYSWTFNLRIRLSHQAYFQGPWLGTPDKT